MAPGPIALQMFVDSPVDGLNVGRRLPPERGQFRGVDDDRDRAHEREVARCEAVSRHFALARVDEFDVPVECVAEVFEALIQRQ